MGLLRRPTPGEIVEGGRLVGPAGWARFARHPKKTGCGCAATSCVSNPKDSRTVKGRLGGGLVFRWAFTQRPLDFDGGVHGGQQDYGRGGVDDGLAEVEGSSSVMVAISRCLPHTLPSTLATVASSLAYWIPLGQAAASIRVIHPLRVMLLHPGLAIT
jgi:hypothetical protein